MKLKYVQPGQAAGTPFRPVEFTDAYAVVFWPTRVDRNRGSVKSEARCTLAVFDTEDSAPRVIEDVVVTQGDIFWSLLHAHKAEAILVGYIGQGDETKYGTKPWVIKALDPADAKRIAEACEGVLG